MDVDPPPTAAADVPLPAAFRHRGGPAAAGDLVWVDTRNGPWPAIVLTIDAESDAATVRLTGRCDSRTPTTLGVALSGVEPYPGLHARCVSLLGGFINARL